MNNIWGKFQAKELLNILEWESSINFEALTGFLTESFLKQIWAVWCLMPLVFLKNYSNLILNGFLILIFYTFRVYYK